MEIETVILILFAVVVMLEFVTGQIFIFKKSSFPDYSTHPDRYWEHLSWHFAATALLAVLKFL